MRVSSHSLVLMLCKPNFTQSALIVRFRPQLPMTHQPHQTTFFFPHTYNSENQSSLPPSISRDLRRPTSHWTKQTVRRLPHKQEDRTPYPNNNSCRAATLLAPLGYYWDLEFHVPKPSLRACDTASCGGQTKFGSWGSRRWEIIEEEPQFSVPLYDEPQGTL